jgi:hypothetical protein
LRKIYLHRSSPIILLLILFICGAAYASQYSIGENGSNAQAVHDLGITGLGVKVGLVSCRNVRDTHLAFNDSNGVHVFNSDYSGSGVNWAGGDVPGHDTWVTGIVASRGWTGHPGDIGVSPGCDVYSARVVTDSDGINLSFIQNALNYLISIKGCKVILTGFQLPSNIDPNWSRMYDYYAEQYDVVFANASGNSYANVTVFGDGYNGITTAALIDEPNNFYLQVGSLSNPGPAIDGRKKPEISCPGSSQTTPSIGSDTDYYTTVKDGATSFAVPQAAGVAALLLQYANGTPEADDGHSEVIKAVIVNSTFPNIKDKQGHTTNPTVWDPNRGYGRIDALRAFNTLSAGKISKGTTVTSTAGWAYDTMSSSATHNYYVAGKKNERLVLTVTWNRLMTMTKNGSNYYYHDEASPQFNMDVNVYNPSSSLIYSETDTKNNLVKIDMLLPADGNYTVSLHNTTTKNNRAYGLAFELLEPITGDFNLDYIVDEKDLNRMAIEWLTAGPDADIVHDSSNIVNYLDFAAFADNWLKFDQRYFTP